LQVGHLRPRLGCDHFGDDERLAETGVESHGDVAGDLDVLTLILAHGHLVGVVQEDVGRLQGRVGEKSGRHEIGLTLGGLVLELRHATEFAVRDRALGDPAQLGVFGNVTLYEHRGDLGVETPGEQCGGQFERARSDQAGAIGHGERVQIDDAVEGVAFVLPDDPVAKRTQVVAEVNTAGGLNAGQDPGHASQANGDDPCDEGVLGRERGSVLIAPISLGYMAVDVSTPVFEGPFDLLLHLILKEQVDIHEVSLSVIVDAYLSELRTMQSLDLEVATEFLLIAATLVELKARRLLPGREDVDLDEELALWEERDLLLSRLLECKTFKDVGQVFGRLADAADRTYARRCGPDERYAALMPDLLEGVKPTQIHAAFVRASTPKAVPKVDLFHLGVIKASVSDALVELVDELPRVRRISFRRLTSDLADRMEVIVRFLALLELFKQGYVELAQGERFGDIDIVWIGQEASVVVGSIPIDDYEG